MKGLLATWVNEKHSTGESETTAVFEVFDTSQMESQVGDTIELPGITGGSKGDLFLLIHCETEPEAIRISEAGFR